MVTTFFEKIRENMRTTLIILFGWILFLTLAACSENYIPKKYMGLQGKIISLRDTVYGFKHSFYTLRIPDEVRSIRIINFDDRGNITEQYEYLRMDSIPFEMHEYLYSGDTLLKRCTQTRMSDGTYSTLVFEFVSQNNDVIKYKLNNGYEIWEQQVKTSGKYYCSSSKGEWGYSKEEQWFDKNNNIIKWKLLSVSDAFKSANKDGSNTLSMLHMYKYDSNNNLIEEKYIEDDDTTVFTHSYTRYDEQGNWTERKTEKDSRYESLIRRTITYAE